MVRLPEIGIQAWLDDQVNRFQETTSGYFDALEFDLGARDAESQIPSDYPLPGGPDQWDEAERRNLEEAEKRRQEEEERRRLEQQAQEQALQAQQAQEAMQAQQAAFDEQQARYEAQAMSTASDLGIPTPDQAFSSFLGMAQRPRDNLSSVLFDRDSPLPGNNEVITNPEQPSNPVSDFMNWASGYTGAAPTPDPASPEGEPPRDNTSSALGWTPEDEAEIERNRTQVRDTITGGLRSGWETLEREGPIKPLARPITNVIRDIQGRPHVTPEEEDAPITLKTPFGDYTGRSLPQMTGAGMAESARTAREGVEQAVEGYQEGDAWKAGFGALGVLGELDPVSPLARGVGEMLPKVQTPFGEVDAGDIVAGAAGLKGLYDIGKGATKAAKWAWDNGTPAMREAWTRLTKASDQAVFGGADEAATLADEVPRSATPPAPRDRILELENEIHYTVRDRGLIEQQLDDAIRANADPDQIYALERDLERALEAEEDIRQEIVQLRQGLPEPLPYNPGPLPPVAPAGWGETGRAMGAAESDVMGSGILGERARPGSVIGAVTGGVSGAAAGDEETTWQERLRNSMLGAAVGGTAGGVAAKQGTIGAARLIDSLISRGRWSPDILQTHPEARTRIKTLLGLAAEGRPDDEIVELPGQASFLALSHMPELTDLSKFLNGRGTAGEVRALVRQSLPKRFETAVSELVADVVTASNTRATRAGERRADLVTARGLPEELRGIRDPRPDYPRPMYPSVFGTAQEIDQHPDPEFEKLSGWVGQIADELGIDPPRTFVANHPQLNAGIHYPRGHKPIMVVTTGVLDADLTPGEVRGLLMHEMGHLAERQGMAARGELPPGYARSLADDLDDVEVPNPYPLTPEEQALNAAADARARAAPRHSGYLEDPSYTGDEGPSLADVVKPVPEPADDARQFNLLEMVDAIRGMRKAGYTNEMLLAGEKYLAENTSLTLDAVQGLTRATGQVTEAELRAAGMVLPEAVPPWSMPKQYPTPSRAPTGGVGPSPAPTVTPMAPVSPNSSYTPPGIPTTTPSAVAATPSFPKADSVTGTPDGVKQATENYARLTAQEQARKNAPADVTDADIDYILGHMQGGKFGAFDRHARLSAATRYLKKKLNRKLTDDEDAWLQARLHPGQKQAALDLKKAIIKPALSAVKPEHQHLVGKTMTQLDTIDVDNMVPHHVQQRLLNETPEGRAPVGEVRREGEATLESQRARANLNATERAYTQARAERDALLREMEQAGEGPTRAEGSYKRGRNGVPGGPLPEAAMETERFTRRADQLEKANIRVEQARVRRDDASRIVAEKIKQSEVKRTDAKLERAATRAEEVRGERKYTAGISPVSRDDIIAALKNQIGAEDADKVMAAIEANFKARDIARDMLFKAGLISQDELDYLVKNFPNYSPTRILDKLNQAEAQQHGGKTFSVGSSPIKKLTEQGSEAERMDPVEAVSEMVSRAYDLASSNRVMQAVERWTDIPEMRELVRPIKEAKDLPNIDDWEAMSVYIGGEKNLLAVRKEVAQSLKLGEPGLPAPYGPAFRAISAPLRVGATAGRPSFIALNAINDAIGTTFRHLVNAPSLSEAARAALMTDLAQAYWTSLGSRNLATRAAVGGFTSAGAQATATSREQENDPYYWQKVGAAGLVGAGLGTRVKATKGQRELLQRMSQAGATIGQKTRFSQPEDVVRQLRGENIIVRTLSDDPGMMGKFKRAGERLSDLGGLLWTRPLAEVGSVAEDAPRIAAFRRAERLGKTQAQAAMDARRITADFDAGGEWSKKINDAVPFLNATTQALVESADTYRKNPWKWKAATAGVIGTLIGLEAWNRAVAPEAYKDVSEYTKNTGAVIMSDKPPEGKGKHELAYIPLRGQVGAMVPTVRALMSAWYGDDPRTWKKLALDTGIATFNQMSPIGADVEGLATMGALPLASQSMALLSNYDWFRGQPIVSRSQEGLPVSEQYTDRTAMAARHLGRLTGVSPTKIDWAARNVSPGPGEAFLNTADALIHKAGLDLPTTERDIPKGARDVPIFGPISGRILRTVGSERQNKAYERAEDLTAEHSSAMVARLEALPAYQQATPDRQRQMLRTAETELQERARAQAGVPAFKEPRNLGLPARFIGVKPGSETESEIARALATAEKKRTPRQRSLVSRYESRQNPRWAVATARDRAENEAVRQLVGGALRR